MALPTASDNNFPKVLLDMQTSSPAAPSNEDWKLYAKPGGIFARSSNAEVGPFGASTGLVDPMTTRGDIIVRNSSNVSARLAVGSNATLFANGTDDSWLPLPVVATFTDRGTHANYTTTGTSFADLDTPFNLTITTGAVRRVLVIFSAMVSNSGASTTCFDVTVDGTRQGHATLGLIGGNNGPWPLTLNYLTAPLAAGSHTFKIQWKVSAGTGTVFANTTGIGVHMSVIEQLS